jgi:hypothetical protein
MCLFAVISNSMVIIAVWKIKKMRNVTNILICNLSISDIILAGIILPLNLHDLSHEEDFVEKKIKTKSPTLTTILLVLIPTEQ